MVVDISIGAASSTIWYLCSLFYRSVSEAIHSWEPDKNSENETKLRKNLFDHLRKSLPESCIIIEEYGKERSKVDIAITENSFEKLESENFAIELKFRLKKKTDVDRLLGQVLGYKNLGFEKTFIVAVDSESNMKELLSHRAKDPALTGRVALIEK